MSIRRSLVIAANSDRLCSDRLWGQSLAVRQVLISEIVAIVYDSIAFGAYWVFVFPLVQVSDRTALAVGQPNHDGHKRPAWANPFPCKKWNSQQGRQVQYTDAAVGYQKPREVSSVSFSVTCILCLNCVWPTDLNIWCSSWKLHHHLHVVQSPLPVSHWIIFTKTELSMLFYLWSYKPDFVWPNDLDL